MESAFENINISAIKTLFSPINSCKQIMISFQSVRFQEKLVWKVVRRSRVWLHCCILAAGRSHSNLRMAAWPPAGVRHPRCT